MVISFLYKQLITRLNALVPEIKHIDLYNAQLTHEGEEHPWECPAAFVEFTEINWDTRGNRKQEGDCDLRLYIMTDAIGLETDSNQSSGIIDNGLAHLELLNKVFAALQGYEDADNTNNVWFSKLVRVRMSMDNNFNKVTTHMISFRCRLYDNAAVPVLNSITVIPTVQGGIAP